MVRKQKRINNKEYRFLKCCLIKNGILISQVRIMLKDKLKFCACNMLAKKRINRNKLDNKAKSDNKNLDFMPFIQNNINGHIELE